MTLPASRNGHRCRPKRDTGGSFYPLGDRADLLKDPDADRALEAVRKDPVRYASGPSRTMRAMLLLRCHGHGEGKTVPIA